MIRALLIAALASCAPELELQPDAATPTCTELGCEHALCSGTDGACRCVPPGQTDPVVCTRE